jgi:hypothetical protein
MTIQARVISAAVAPENVDKLRSMLNEVVVPAARVQPGFCGALTLLDQGTGKGMMISLWASPEDLVAGEASGYLSRQIAAVAPILRSPALRETYQVDIATGPDGPFGFSPAGTEPARTTGEERK